MEEVVYALVDPRDNLEFYVGRTQDIYKRFVQHISYEKSNTAKCARIQELKSLHLLPIIRTLEVVKDDSALAAQREAYWIRHFSYLGIELTNGIVYSGLNVEDELKEKLVRVGNSRRVKATTVAKRVNRILKRDPQIGPTELGKLVGISKGHASRLKTKFMSGQEA